MKLKLPIVPLPKQKLFFNCPADNILFGGAKSGGKSYIAVAKAWQLAMLYPGIHIGLFRRSLTEIRESLLRYCFELFPKGSYHFTETKRTFTFFSTGSRITLNFCENDKDLLNYEGWEFQVLIIDEAVRFTPYHLSKLGAATRSGKVIGFKPKVYYLTNPLGIAAAYLKEKFITDKDPYKIYHVLEEFVLPDGKIIEIDRTYCYIPCNIYDNTYLINNNPEYLGQLQDLPEDEREALLHGMWDSKSFQFFNMFDKKTHVIEEYTPALSDTLFMSIDWGTSKPFAVCWYAQQQSGRIIKYREYYGIKGKVPDEGCNMVATDVARNCLKFMKDTEHMQYCVLDNACWAQHGHGITIFEMFHNVFKERKIPIIKCTKDIVNNLELVKYYLSQKIEGIPLFTFTSSCKHSIRVYPGLVPSEKHDGCLETGSEDHLIDCDSYFLASRPKPKLIDNYQETYGTMEYYKQ